MLLIGHRGCYYPGYNQNTIRAFDKVAKEGVPAIEFDVQLTADGQLVVVHNLDLEEVSTGKGAVVSTDSRTIKSFYAGDPARGKDRIPFLSEVFDFFAAINPERRPAIHLELKGNATGVRVGELFTEYVGAEKLRSSDLLVSSFNWRELADIRKVCPELQIALLDGAIRRTQLLEKIGRAAEQYFERVFAYGCEEYMLPKFDRLEKNLQLLKEQCPDVQIRSILADEISACLTGRYYTEDMLDTACNMNAVSVNLWFRSLSRDFVERAHDRGLLVLVYTVNDPDDLMAVARMGVDGIFTDYYAQASRLLADYL